MGSKAYRENFDRAFGKPDEEQKLVTDPKRLRVYRRAIAKIRKSLGRTKPAAKVTTWAIEIDAARLRLLRSMNIKGAKKGRRVYIIEVMTEGREVFWGASPDASELIAAMVKIAPDMPEPLCSIEQQGLFVQSPADA